MSYLGNGEALPTVTTGNRRQLGLVNTIPPSTDLRSLKRTRDAVGNDQLRE